MRSILLLVACLLVLPALATSYDLEILEEHTTYELRTPYTSTGLESGSEYNMLTTVERTIQINSLAGLEEVKTLYIPTYKDFHYKFELVDITATTRKADGREITLSPSEMRETTLPANARLLRNYKGKVKMLAFPDLAVGDRVHYVYRTRFRSSLDGYSWESNDRVYVASSYPIKTASYTYKLHDEVRFEASVHNSDDSFVHLGTDTDGSEGWQLTLRDVAPISERPYHEPAATVPYFDFTYVRRHGYKPITTWEALVADVFDERIRKGSNVFAGKTIGNLKDAVPNGTSPDDAIRIINQSLFNFSDLDAIQTYSLKKYLYAGLYDALQYHTLLRKLDIESYIVLMASRSSGGLNQKNVSFDQFDEVMIQWKSNDGQLHLMPLFKPFAHWDEIPAEYQGTEAVRIARQGRENTIDFITLPISSTVSTMEKTGTMKLSVEGSELMFRGQRTVVETGEFVLDDRMDFNIEERDAEVAVFSKPVENWLRGLYPNCDSAWVSLVENDTNTRLSWTEEYEFSIANTANGPWLHVPMHELMDYTYYLSSAGRLRDGEAVEFGFANTRSFSVTVEPPSGYQLVPNNFMNASASNSIAGFTATCKAVDGGRLQIDYAFEVKVPRCGANQWPEYLQIRDVAYRFGQQQLVAKKL